MPSARGRKRSASALEKAEPEATQEQAEQKPEKSKKLKKSKQAAPQGSEEGTAAAAPDAAGSAAPGLLPPDTCVSVSAACRGVTEDGEAIEAACADDVAFSSATWVTASVIRGEFREGNGSADVATGVCLPWHRLCFEDGKKKWICLEQWRFLAHPPHRKTSQAEAVDSVEDPCRALMAAHCDRVHSASSSKIDKKAWAAQPEQKAWMQQLLRAGSAGDIAELANEHADRFDAVNISIALHRLGRHVPAEEGTHTVSDAVWQAVTACCRRAKKDGLQGYSAQAAANICWAMAKMNLRAGAKDDAKMADTPKNALGPVVAALLRLAAQKALSDFHWSACADWAEVSKWTDDWSRSGLWAGWKPQELSNLCYAVPRIAGGRPEKVVRQFLCAVGQGAAISSWYGFSPQEMANVVRALLPTGCAAPLVVKRTLSKISRNLNMFKPQELCNVLQSAAKSKYSKDELRPVVLKVLAAAVAADLKGYNSADLANLMWCLGVVYDRKDIHDSEQPAANLRDSRDARDVWKPFVELVAAQARQKLQSWKPVEVSQLVHGLSRLEVVDDKIFQMVCDRWRSLMETCDVSNARSGKLQSQSTPGATQPQVLSSVAMALAKSAHIDRAFLASICAFANAALQQDSNNWGIQEVANVLWAGSCQIAFSGNENEDDAFASELTTSVRCLLKTIVRCVKKGKLHLLEGSSAATQLYVASLALEAARKSGLCDETAWTPTASDVEMWKRSYEGQRGMSQANEDWLAARSKFHTAVSSMLSGGVLKEVFPKGVRLENEANIQGLRVDIVLRPKGGSAPIAVEVDGPSHFVRCLDSAAAESAPRTNGQTRLKRWLLCNIAGVEVASIASHDWSPDPSAFDADAAKKLLIGTLRKAISRSERGH